MLSARHSRRQSSGSFQMSARMENRTATGMQTGKRQKTLLRRSVLTESVQDTGMQNLQIVIREAGERGEELFVLETAKYVRP